MSTRFYGSICVSDIVDLAHKKHSAFTKGDNGKIYAAVNVWLNDDVDKFGNIMSIQLSPKKELKEQDGQPYIGNCKEAQAKPIDGRAASGLSLPDDIAVAQKAATNTTTDANGITEPIDDLPF